MTSYKTRKLVGFLTLTLESYYSNDFKPRILLVFWLQTQDLFILRLKTPEACRLLYLNSGILLI